MSNQDIEAALELKGVTIKGVHVAHGNVTMLGDDGGIYTFRINDGYDGPGDENPRHPFLEVRRSQEQQYALPDARVRVKKNAK